jgi:hypothetical protein
LLNNHAIVILSFDGYADLWRTMTESVVKNLGELRVPIYLVSNEIETTFPGTTGIQTGFDEDWSTSFLVALKKIREEYLLILLDDMPLLSKPNLIHVTDCFNLMNFSSLVSLQPRSVRRIRKNNQQHGYWYEFTAQDSYTANVFGFWRNSMLREILRTGESSWDFEVYGSKRLNEIGKSGALINDLFKYAHLVEKKEWVKNISQLNSGHHLKLNLSSRGTAKTSNTNTTVKRILFMLVLDYFPIKSQFLILKLFRRMAQFL